MYCKHCGAKIADGSKFCKHCGKPVGSTAAASADDGPQAKKAAPVAERKATGSGAEQAAAPTAASQPAEPSATSTVQSAPAAPTAASTSQPTAAQQSTRPQPAPSAPQQPAPGQPVPGAPAPFQPVPGAPAKKRHTGVKIALGAVAALFAIVVVGILLFTVGPLQREGAQLAMGDAYAENLSPDQFDLKSPEYDILDGQTFKYDLDDSVDLGLKELEGSSDYKYATVQNAVKVYVDPSFTQEFPTKVTQVKDEDGNRLEVEPGYLSAQDKSIDPTTNPGATGMDDIFHVDSRPKGKGQYGGRWYGFGGYYLVRYLGEDGKKLEKPEVTYFTTKNDVDKQEKPLEAPQNVKFAVQDNGGLGIGWDKVDGAKKYKVYMRVNDPTYDNLDGTVGRIEYDLLAVTDKTQINTLDYDYYTQSVLKNPKSYMFSYGGAGATMVHQNEQFRDLVIGDNEDEVFGNRQDTEKGVQGLEVADYQPNAQHVKGVSITVVACGDDTDQQSPFKFQSINSLLGQIPIQRSDNIDLDWIRKAPSGKDDPAGFLRQHLISYVTMADGTTASMTNVFDTSKMTSKQSTMIEGEDANDPSTWHTREYTYSEIPYTVRNTIFTDTFSFEGSWFPGGADQINQVASEQLDALTKENPAIGTPQRAKLDDGTDWDKVQASQKVSTTKPDVDYPVSGSSEYVKYVAANIMAGNLSMDVTQFASKPGAPDFSTVFQEAVAQNPMTLLSDTYASYRMSTKDEKSIVTVYDTMDPEHNDTTKMNEERKKVWAEVKKIVDGAVTDGMSETDKVKAINKALCARLSYDYDFFYLMEGKTDMIKDDKVKANPFMNRGTTAAELLGSNKVICGGYSQIFKACADYAGIESVYVTGTIPPTPGMPNNGHAWNLVKDGDAWKVVDVTWDDKDRADATDEEQQQYLMIDQTDAKLAGRMYDRDTMPSTWYDRNVDASLLAAA